MNDKESILLGNEARVVVNNRAFQQAITEMKGKLLLEFENTKFFQTRKRDEIWRQMRTISDFERNLAKMTNSATIAQNSIDLQEKKVNLRGL